MTLKDPAGIKILKRSSYSRKLSIDFQFIMRQLFLTSGIQGDLFPIKSVLMV